jgi:hypothetical protein
MIAWIVLDFPSPHRFPILQFSKEGSEESDPEEADFSYVPPMQFNHSNKCYLLKGAICIYYHHMIRFICKIFTPKFLKIDDQIMA